MKKLSIAAIAALTMAAAPAMAGDAQKKINSDPFAKAPVVSTQSGAVSAGLAIVGGLALVTVIAAASDT